MDLLSQTGVTIPVEQAAVLTAWLKKNPSLITLQTGRKLLKLTSNRIKGTNWEEIIDPKAQTKEDKEWKVYFDKCYENVGNSMNEIQEFVNNVYLPELIKIENKLGNNEV